MPAFTPKDPALADHLAWLGYVQPEGLVVSAPALVDAQAIIDRAQLGDLQRKFAEQVTSLRLTESDTGETQPGIENLQKFVTEFLGWPYELLVGVDPSKPLPDSLSISLPEFQETLHSSFAVARPPAQIENRKSEIVNSEWLLLVQSHPATVDLDKPAASSERHWHASPAKKFERLLRETGVPIGLLTNGTSFRLIYAPPKENSGALTFPVGAMTEVSGRLILGAFQLLLGSWTLFNAPSVARLPSLLQLSREYQAKVSEVLAEQVLHALYKLLEGFEEADKRAEGKLLRELAARNPADIYGGLVTVLLRLVFTLFAEDRGLLPGSGLYVRHYAVRGLFERLRADAERYPDTMDHRFGAWAQLLALFRVIHGGCKHPDLAMPARAGHLFDPDRYPFLEGRASRSEPIGALPLVSDGTLHRILEKLCILEGERVSYRTLDVEEIGSVYQTIMGFGVETAAGTAIALKGKRKNGGVPASPVISLEQLLATPAKDRAKWLKENADTDLTGEADKRLKAAATVDDLLVALEKRIDRHATPAPVAQGGLVLQPTDERRRSGSHYTPRSFTEPIVRKTLEPILRRLAEEAGKGEVGRGNSEKPTDYGNHQQLSRPASLAGRQGAGPADLPRNQNLPHGGAIRTDLADAPGSGVDSLEHRGGLVTPAPSGIPPVSPGIAGQSGGTGDTGSPQSGLGVDAGDDSQGTSQSVRHIEPTASGLGTSVAAVSGGGKGEEASGKSGAGPSPFPFPASPTPLPSSLLSLKICDIAVGSAAFLVETCRQLADVLVRAWRVHGGRPALPPDETEELLAMRTIAQRCLYGVDRNPMAVDLAKLSLWLATLAKDHPFTFLDHAIRCGDSLVGLTRRQIETFTWKTDSIQGQLWEAEVRKRTAAALRERQNLLGLGDDYGTPQLKREKLEKADELLDLVRFIGDAAVAAFFAADKDKAREAKRAELAERIADYLGKGDLKQRPTDEVKALRGGQFPVTPFHWEIEYPEVFDRENPGFDGIVGNPPFFWGNRISRFYGEAFRQWLMSANEGSNGNADLVVYFLRRAFLVIRQGGAFGLITTNSISETDTRVAGLGYVLDQGAVIFAAHSDAGWPGQASVRVSIVHVSRGAPPGHYELDGESVKGIGADLRVSTGGDQSNSNPSILAANSGKSFKGVDFGGDGFLISDSEFEKIRLEHVAELPFVWPVLNSQDFGSIVDDAPLRHIINFTGCSLEQAQNAPFCLSLVESRVKPGRESKKGSERDCWWLYRRAGGAYSDAVKGRHQVLVGPVVAKFLSFGFFPHRIVFTNALNVFAFDSHAAFAVLQSNSHQIWALRFASTLRTDTRYNPSDCFETFPFPAGFETSAALEAAGREYYEFRAALMQDLWLGLTEIYNLFHSPDDEALARLEALYRKRAATPEWRTAESVPADRSPLTLYATPAAALAAVQRLRTLHAAMDTAVLTAYGWTDLLPKCTCEFLLDYEDESEAGLANGAEESGGRKKKKPWRYRWPDEVRDEVLARLLKLNAERAEEEKLAGQAAAAAEASKPKKARGKKSAAAPAQGDLLPNPQPDFFA